VHHLDLPHGKPSEEGIAETRRVLDGLLGRPAPINDSLRYILVGTGRESPTEKECQALGVDTERLPLFG
ncbi:MAG: maleylpyruvate isomerase, partial [Ornithinimicrobium sp.]